MASIWGGRKKVTLLVDTVDTCEWLGNGATQKNGVQPNVDRIDGSCYVGRRTRHEEIM